ncbi:MAG: phage major capsid protein, partial [Gemmatimonadota bacterium]|nr:phage major capsid protein [Gemmatimonadota bacterium]
MSDTALLAELPGPGVPEFSAEDLNRYSIARALRIAAGGESGRGTREMEIHDSLSAAISRGVGHTRTIQGFLVPLDIRGALDGGTATAGQELVYTRPGSFIDGIRARSVVGSLGATMLQTPLPTAEPRVDTDVTVTWVGEDPGSDLTDTEPVLGSVSYALHTLACTVPYSRQILAQTLGMSAVDRVVARAAEGAIAAELDRVAINGSGVSNEPLGLMGTSGVGVVSIGTNGGAPTYDHIVDLEADVAVSDAEAAQMGFATTPGVRKILRKTERAAGSGMVWDRGGMLDRPGAVSTNIPSNLTKGTGTNLHAILYGNWADL